MHQLYEAIHVDAKTAPLQTMRQAVLQLLFVQQNDHGKQTETSEMLRPLLLTPPTIINLSRDRVYVMYRGETIERSYCIALISRAIRAKFGFAVFEMMPY